MVFDTMVLVYALLGIEGFAEDAGRSLMAARHVWAPDSVRAELANAVWQWIRVRRVNLGEGLAVLRDADLLFTEVCPAPLLWERALELSVACDQPPYDTLFVALAERKGCQVITYDRGLLARFPKQTVTPRRFLGAGR